MKKLKSLLFTTLLTAVFLTGCQSTSNAKPVKTEPDNNNPSIAWIDKTFKDKNIWQYLATKMELDPAHVHHPRVESQIAFYQNKQRYFTDVSTRAEPYMYWLAEQVHKRKMPMELVLIPVIESAFRTDAVSSQNAAGLWQMVPQTGRNYGLKQNKSYDGRHDVVASTEAALDLLEKLNKMFDGDWLLTLAAYNSGEGRVMQAIAKNQRQGKPTDFWSLSSLPKGTQEYVPRILALQQIFKSPAQHGITLAKPDKSHALIPVKVEQPIELTAVAEQIGISENKLKKLNAGYKKGVTSSAGEHYILLPRSLEEQFIASIDTGKIQRASASAAKEESREISDSSEQLLVSNKSESTKSSPAVYKIKKGDTLSSVASRMNVTTADLKRWNNLSDKTVLKIGQSLKIQSAQVKTTEVAAAGEVNKSKATKTASSKKTVLHTVKEGDSLAKIAKQHNVQLADLKSWNAVKDDKKLKLGAKLTVYVN